MKTDGVFGQSFELDTFRTLLPELFKRTDEDTTLLEMGLAVYQAARCHIPIFSNTL
jgi:hypothetical protein